MTTSAEKLIGTLKKIEALIEQALLQAHGSTKGLKGRTPTEAKSRPHPGGARPNSLPGHILQLRDQKFFNVPRTAAETHAKLQATYSCEPDRVVMALLRLQKRKQLRRASKVVGQKKQVAYAW